MGVTGRGAERRATARGLAVSVLTVSVLAVSGLVVSGLVVSGLVVGGAALAAPVRAAPPDAPAWTWPLSGPPPVTRAFAPPQSRYGAGHRGVDLGGAPGAPVLAAGAGQVSYAGLLAGRGVVVVQHGELRTTYEPVTAEVGVGQQVAADEPLGRLDAGHAGCPVVACLHWGLRRGEQYLDPLSLVGAGPVRLLPVLEQAAAPAAGTGRARSGPADPAPADPAPAAPEPALDLRAVTSPSGALAVAALLAGLALLARPRPPDRPAGGAASGTVHTGAPPSDPVVEPEHPGAQVHDLARERARRTAGGS